MHKKTDVIIAGGGLGGLSLAYQLKSNTPDLDILVLERNTFPVPNTTAKVGESTVELASHYMTETLGLKDHFKKNHLRKHGLRCFFGTPQDDFAQQDELGVSELFGIPAYQLDRGVLENHLHEKISSLGVQVVDGANTQQIVLQNHQHTVEVSTAAGQQRFQSKWLVDAAGRQKLLTNKLGLNKSNSHKGNALWFRINKKIVIDEWSDNASWQERLKDSNTRWLSTNHLMGQGYWVWVIPLGTETTSIGIVMDNQVVEENDLSSYDKAMHWLEQHQPKCAAAIAGAEVLDFKFLRDYSYGCKQMFSDEGWGITGEAGAFTDPFYSPGSDFIALNNTFINHLISNEKRGQDIRRDSAMFHLFYNSFFENTLSLYTGQYGGFGDRRMMGIKLLWDYAYYWGVLTLLFYKQAITDIDLMLFITPTLRRAQDLNLQVQKQLRTRAQKRLVLPSQGIFMDQRLIPCLNYFNNVLKAADNIDINTTLADNIALLDRIAKYSINMLDDNADATISDDERELLGDYRHCILA